MAMTEKQYVRGKGLKCPVCKGSHIQGGDIETADGGMAYQNCTCLECEASWTDHWRARRGEGYSMTIWGRYKNNPPERIDSCAKSEVNYLLGEYRLAFGRDWTLWAGRKGEENGRDQD